MTQRLPGTKPLDTFRAKGGRYLSVLLDGPATSDAEMKIARLFDAGTRAPMQDYRAERPNQAESEADHLTRDNIVLSVYPDASVLLRRQEERNDVVFPLGVQLDRWNLASAIEATFSPIRIKAGYSRLSVSDLAEACISDLLTMLYAQECSAIVEEIFSDASRLFDARAPLGLIQDRPTDEPGSGFFPPLRGLPRTHSGIERDLGALHAALQAEMQMLCEDVPFIRNEWPELVVRGSIPDRDGTLRQPTAHLLMNENPMDWEVASLIQPALDAYCASSALVPNRAAVAEYKCGRTGRGPFSPPGPLPALESINLMVIRPRENLTAHEVIETAALREKRRVEHADQIQSCADALDVPWAHTAPAHAQRYEDEDDFV
jgi:hypothetical protein